MKKIEKIQLIDDDKITNFINYRLLSILDISTEIKTSANGLDALYQMNNESSCPELIFLDINMPVMDGFEFLSSFNSCSCSMHKPVIVVLTTSSNYEDMNRMRENPLVSCIMNKPLTEQKIRVVLEKY